MKVLLSILVVVAMFVSCKQTPKTDTVVAEEVNKSATESQLEKEEIKTQETTQNKEQTIEEFLQQLQIAVKNDDIATIEKSIKFPFEFKSGGESEFYKGLKELKNNYGKFSEIINSRLMTDEETKFLDKQENTFFLIYKEYEEDDYFIMYTIVREGKSFKLTVFEEPN
jgi:hypothetical protein